MERVECFDMLAPQMASEARRMQFCRFTLHRCLHDGSTQTSTRGRQVFNVDVYPDGACLRHPRLKPRSWTTRSSIRIGREKGNAVGCVGKETEGAVGCVEKEREREPWGLGVRRVRRVTSCVAGPV